MGSWSSWSSHWFNCTGLSMLVVLAQMRFRHTTEQHEQLNTCNNNDGLRATPCTHTQSARTHARSVSTPYTPFAHTIPLDKSGREEKKKWGIGSSVSAGPAAAASSSDVQHRGGVRATPIRNPDRRPDPIALDYALGQALAFGQPGSKDRIRPPTIRV